MSILSLYERENIFFFFLLCMRPNEYSPPSPFSSFFPARSWGSEPRMAHLFSSPRRHLAGSSGPFCEAASWNARWHLLLFFFSQKHPPFVSERQPTSFFPFLVAMGSQVVRFLLVLFLSSARGTRLSLSFLFPPSSLGE